MKKLNAVLIIFLLAMASFAAGSQPEKVRVFLYLRGIPDFSPSVDLMGGRVLHSYEILDNVLAIEVPVTALQGLLRNPNVLKIELDAEVHASAKGSGGSTQPAQVLPWGVNQIDAELSQNTGAGVTVCVVDTGIDKDHPDLQANIVGGKNFVARGLTIDPAKWDDDNGHGTHVAGTIAAVNNAIGVVGVAPGASLLAAKVLNRQGSGYISDVIAGIDYCVANGAKIVSMSLGSSTDIQALHDAVDAAYSNGALLVAAAGNSYGGAVSYPAAYSSVIAVSATDRNNLIASFSSVGPEVELSAPGVNILSAWKDGVYKTISGTSMATPHVSGVAALAMQANPSLSNAEIRALLQNSADDLGVAGRDNLYGYGLVDAELQ